ncbi:MAG: hypothetical protein HC913_09210 [Microscillaceae bacterium]|nr:hypothetical protein [Microscillaceae bacterium]
MQEALPGAFQLMDYYRYSSANEYLQGHFSHRFDGLLLGKIPGLRNLGWAMLLEANYLYTEALPHYLELGIGIEKIFSLLRIDYYYSLNRAENAHWGIRLRFGS